MYRCYYIIFIVFIYFLLCIFNFLSFHFIISFHYKYNTYKYNYDDFTNDFIIIIKMKFDEIIKMKAKLIYMGQSKKFLAAVLKFPTETPTSVIAMKVRGH